MNLTPIIFGAALVGAASFGLYAGFRFLERSAIKRRRTDCNLRDLYEDNKISCDREGGLDL